MSTKKLETTAKYRLHKDPSQVTNYPVRKFPFAVMADCVFNPSCEWLIES